ncbi:hypothetical protein AB0M20_27500 [Actinoplanes sp. NPDC051633]|uniref:hypothetical protein n=1 Tax=Actinoplanes sp. NPDC051633 TaxID=3155670 RepID=UPI003439F65A
MLADEQHRRTPENFPVGRVQRRGIPGGGWSAADIPLLDEAAELIGEEKAGPHGDGSLAGRAARDQRWAYGHVVVDEAQELSAMAWRMVLRRVPGRSMTVAGDVGQTSAPGGADSWEGALRPHAGDRWRMARLSVNYRTPAEIMDAAAPLRRDDGGPVSVRAEGVLPWRMRTTERELAGRLAAIAARRRDGVRWRSSPLVIESGTLSRAYPGKGVT